MAIIYPNGYVELEVAATEKIAVLSNDNCVIRQKVAYPNQPASWLILGSTTPGVQYVSSAFSATATVRIEAGADYVHYDVGTSPSASTPTSGIAAADDPLAITGYDDTQGGAVNITAGASSTASNAGGAIALTGGTAGATGIGGSISITGSDGGATSGAGGAVNITSGSGTAGNGDGGRIVITAGSKHGTGLDGDIVAKSLLVTTQGNPTAKTTTATLTAAELLTGILTGTHTAGATQTYTLPTGTLMDAACQLEADECFDWFLINLSAAAVDTLTIAAGADHTFVGNAVVQAAHATTGLLYGTAAHLRTRKTAANTFVTYRIV